MQRRSREIRLGKAGEQTVVRHRLRTAPRSSAGCSIETSVPGVLVRRRVAHGGEVNGHVDVVPARVHHADRGPVVVAGSNLRGVRQARLFSDGERRPCQARTSSVGPAPFLSTLAALSADAGGHLEPQLLQHLREPCGRRFLVERMFGSGMELFVKLGKFAEIRNNPSPQLIACRLRAASRCVAGDCIAVANAATAAERRSLPS